MAITPALLATLGRGARLAAPYIEGFVKDGLGISEIQEKLRALEAPTRRADILELVHAVQERITAGVNLRSLRDDLRPDPSRLASPITNTLRRFSFIVRIDGTDAETGEDRSEIVTVSSSTLLTGRELKDKALSFVPDIEEARSGSDMLSGITEPSAVVLTGSDRGF